jgi:hypothetical protein
LSALKQFEPHIKGKSADVNALKLSLKLSLIKGKSAGVTPPHIDTAREHFDLM